MTLSELAGFLSGNEVASTAILIATAIAIRFVAQRLLSRETLETDYRRRLLSNLRNGLFLVLIVGIILIWAPALRTFALSLTAFAVAFIIATKELILCVSGATLKASSRSIKVGDWIEVSGLRGEVVDQNIFSTILQELSKDGHTNEFTGRTIALPNSIFLTAPIINEQFFKRYVFHSFQLIVEPSDDIEGIEKAIIETINEEMADHLEVAKRYRALIEKKAEIQIGDVEPQSKIVVLNDGKLKLLITAFLPTQHASSIEQKALRSGLQKMRQLPTQ